MAEAGGWVKVLDSPPMSPKKIPKAQSPTTTIVMVIPKFIRSVYHTAAPAAT